MATVRLVDGDSGDLTHDLDTQKGNKINLPMNVMRQLLPNIMLVRTVGLSSAVSDETRTSLHSVLMSNGLNLIATVELLCGQKLSSVPRATT